MTTREITSEFPHGVNRAPLAVAGSRMVGEWKMAHPFCRDRRNGQPPWVAQGLVELQARVRSTFCTRKRASLLACDVPACACLAASREKCIEREQPRAGSHEKDA
jgi:hypothetical protein